MNTILMPTLSLILLILLVKASHIGKKVDVEGMGDNRDNMEQIGFDKDKEEWAKRARDTFGSDEHYNKVLAMPNVSEAKAKYYELLEAYKKAKMARTNTDLNNNTSTYQSNITNASWGDGSVSSRPPSMLTNDADLKAPWAKAAFSLGDGNRQDYANEVMSTVSENAAKLKYQELASRWGHPTQPTSSSNISYNTAQNDVYTPHDGPANANESSNNLYAAHDSPSYIGNMDKQTIIDPPGILGTSSLIPQQPADGGMLSRPVNITITSNVGPYGYVESRQQPNKMNLKHAIGEKTAKQLTKNLNFMEIAIAQSQHR